MKTIRRKVLIVLMLAVCLCAGLLFAACGDKDNDKDKDTDGGGAGFAGTKSVAQQKLEAMANDTGFEISIRYSTQGSPDPQDNGEWTVVYGSKQDNFWVRTDAGSDASGWAIKKDGTSYHQYYWSNNAWEFQETLNAEAAAAYEQLNSSFISGLVFAVYDNSAFLGKLAKSGTETIAGRTCDKWTYSMALGADSVSFAYCLDRELGICMKYTVETGGTTASYEVTAFNTSPAVPAFPEPSGGGTTPGGETTEWPTALLAQTYPDGPTFPVIQGYTTLNITPRSTADRNLVAIKAFGITRAEFDAYKAALIEVGFTSAGVGYVYEIDNPDIPNITVTFDIHEENQWMQINIGQDKYNTTPSGQLAALPENVEISYTVDSTAISIIKIAQDYYVRSIMSDGGAEFFYKHADSVWTEYFKDGGSWTATNETFTENELYGKLRSTHGFQYLLDNDVEGYTEGEAQTIAGRTCRTYTLTQTYPQTTIATIKCIFEGIVFKHIYIINGAETATFEITSFDTTVTGFGDITPPQ